MRDPLIDDPEAMAHTRVLRLAGHLIELGALARELADEFGPDGIADELAQCWLKNAGEELQLLAGRIVVGLFGHQADLFAQVREAYARRAELKAELEAREAAERYDEQRPPEREP